MGTKVEAFKSKDGILFETEEQCQIHDNKIAFFDDYWEDKLYGNYAGSYVEPSDLLEYVDKHWDRLKSILNR